MSYEEAKANLIMIFTEFGKMVAAKARQEGYRAGYSDGCRTRTIHVIEKGSKMGFQHLPPEQQREIARKGGKAAQSKGVAHRFSKEEAKEAGSKGGKAVSQDREHMAEIGRKGGAAGVGRKRDEDE